MTKYPKNKKYRVFIFRRNILYQYRIGAKTSRVSIISKRSGGRTFKLSTLICNDLLRCNGTSSPIRMKLYYGIAMYRSLSVHPVYIYTRGELGTYYHIYGHWHSLDFINNNYCHISNVSVPLSAASTRQTRIPPFCTNVDEIRGKVRNDWFCWFADDRLKKYYSK